MTLKCVCTANNPFPCRSCVNLAEQEERYSEPYYGDCDSNLHDEMVRDAMESMEDDDTLGEDPLETYKWFKEMGMCD